MAVTCASASNVLDPSADYDTSKALLRTSAHMDMPRKNSGPASIGHRCLPARPPDIVLTESSEGSTFSDVHSAIPAA